MEKAVKVCAIMIRNGIIPVQLQKIRFWIWNIGHWSENKLPIFRIIHLQGTENDTIFCRTVGNSFIRIQKTFYIFLWRICKVRLLRHTEDTWFPFKKIHWDVRIQIVHFYKIHQIIWISHSELPYQTFYMLYRN